LTTAAVEEWRPIAGYEGLYEVSNLGQVRSLDVVKVLISRNGNPYKKHFYGRVLKPGFNKATGYYNVSLYNQSGKGFPIVLHRVVAKAFLSNPNNLPEVNHKDENKANNRADNLEWCTRVYNINYGVAKYKKTRRRWRAIEQLTLNGESVAIYDCMREAERKTGYSQGNLWNAINKVRPAYGYRWRYVHKTQGAKCERDIIETITR